MTNSEKIMKDIEEEMNQKNLKEKKESLANLAVKLVQEREVYLFHDEKDDGYAKFQKSGHFEIHKIKSKTFKEFIALLVWFEAKKALSLEAMSSAIGTLEALAKFEGNQHELSVRSAWHEDVLWYDLGDWRAVRISKKGWKIIENPPILFKHFPHQKSQAEPVKGGDIKEILEFLNLKESTGRIFQEPDHILLLTYLPVALIPNIPRAILVIYGDPGTAKTTFFEILKALLDPSVIGTSTPPRSGTELVQMFSHHFVIYFDNLSFLQDWLSDTLSRACTGDAFSKRELYSDDEDVFYYYRRVIGINGINLVVSKPDLLDRALIFELETIPKDKRIEEKKLWSKFEKAKPRILGAIFDILSKAIGIIERKEIDFKEKPRLADYALWCGACAKAMKEDPQSFLIAFDENIKRQNAEALEASAIAQAIMEFMKRKSEWKGTATELLEALQPLDDKGKRQDSKWARDTNWPGAPNWVWRRIKEVRVNLQQVGIETFREEKIHPRIIYLKNRKAKKTTDTAGNADIVDVNNIPF